MNIAIIPARGGSKRIPGKNIRLLGGEPIISYAISAAKDSGLFSHIFVSTDDEQIKIVAEKCGAEVPFFRDPRVADDFSGILKTIQTELPRYQELVGKTEFVCCIYATAFLLASDDIVRGFQKTNAISPDSFCVSVSNFSSNPLRGFLNKNNKLEMLFPQYESTRTQDLPEVYFDAAQFIWGSYKQWLQASGVFNGTTIPIEIDRRRVQDIDVEVDWQMAELMLKAKNSREKNFN